jgi:hypothetical protein
MRRDIVCLRPERYRCDGLCRRARGALGGRLHRHFGTPTPGKHWQPRALYCFDHLARARARPVPGQSVDE